MVSDLGGGLVLQIVWGSGQWWGSGLRISGLRFSSSDFEVSDVGFREKLRIRVGSEVEFLRLGIL